METFGLPAPPVKDMAWVRSQLDDMAGKVWAAYQAVQDGIRGDIDGMAARVGKVDNRIRSSIWGRLRQMDGLVKPALAAVSTDINNQLSQMAGVVDHVAAQTAPPSSPPTDLPYEVGAQSPRAKIYTVVGNHDCTILHAVPGDLGDWFMQGWSPPDGYLAQGQITAVPEDVPLILARWNQPCRQADQKGVPVP